MPDSLLVVLAVMDEAASRLDAPALTFALALGVGMIAQVVARHLRIPGIVVFLAAGVALGPDGVGLVRPQTLGHGLDTIVALAVAVILFEGGINLSFRRLRRQATTIRRLLSVGAVMTGLGAALSVMLTLGWPWRLALIFGSLVIVTGPTVVTPLLRRIRVTQRVQTVLEAEGVLIDPIGAIIAVVTLEMVLAQSAESAALGLLGIPTRLAVGAVVGALGGVLISLLLHFEHIVPEDVRNVFTLALVLACVAASNALVNESGIMAAPVIGIVVANMKTPVLDDLKEFKEQLTVMLVAMLFVLLTADVRVVDVVRLGPMVAVTLLLLMAAVRPAVVAVSSAGSDLTIKERLFMAWLSPRGIVAAAVASLFAQRLTAAGVPGGVELRALVFLVIAATVVLQGLSGSLVASLLGLRRRSNFGYAVIGSNYLGRLLARTLDTADQPVVMVDANADDVAAAKKDGLPVIFGNAHDERVLYRADVEGRIAVIATTMNEGANLLIANRVRDLSRRPSTLVAVDRLRTTVNDDQVKRAGHRVLFGRGVGLEQWHDLIRLGDASVQTWEFAEGSEDDRGTALIKSGRRAEALVLPLTIARGDVVSPVDDRTVVREHDALTIILPTAQRDAVNERMLETGFIPVTLPQAIA